MKFLRVFGPCAALLLLCFACSVLAGDLPAPIPQDAAEREETLDRALALAEGMDLPRMGLKVTPRWLAEEMGLKPHPGLQPGADQTREGDLPQNANFADDLPPVGLQQYNDCTAFAVGYYGISYWNFKELGQTPTADPTKVGSTCYLYNQTCGGLDEGALLSGALRIAHNAGCAFQADFAPGNCVDLPDIALQEDSLPQRARAVNWFFVGKNYPDPGDDPVSSQAIGLMKESLAEGIPVMLSMPVYSSFAALYGVPAGRVYYGPHAVGDARVGRHAIIVAGYYDDSSFPGGGCFYLRNSWGSQWGFGGDIWVTYRFIRQYAYAAYEFDDFPDYSPESYIVLEIDHPRRGDLAVDVDVDGTTVTRHSPWILQYVDERDDMEVVIDISDSVKSSTEAIELVVSDKERLDVGSVREAVLVHDGEFLDFSFADGMDIPDEGTTVGEIVFEGAGGSGGGGGGGCALPVSGILLPMLLLPVVFLVRRR